MASWPYPVAPEHGFWGTVTSTENFCEVDYNITHYVAEFINTVTSIGYIVYAWHGIRMIRTGKLPDASWMPYLALASVGVLSAVFHATLKVQTQRCDGMSMLIAASAPLHRVMTFDQSKQWTRWFSYALISALSVVTVLYVTRNIIIVHQTAFAVICGAVALKTWMLMKARVKNRFLRQRLYALARVGVVTGLGGFGIWLIDQFYCDRLRSLRDSIGLPWGFLLELHGWWHILTGVSAYIYLTLVEVILTDPQVKHGSKNRNLFAWPISTLLKLEEKTQGNGTAQPSDPRKTRTRKRQ